MTRATRESFYESIADRFEGLDHPADVRRRLSVVFDECLRGTGLTARRTLDAGCGYGAFSAAATARGAAVVSLDIGPRLVARAVARAGSRGVVGDACRLPVRDESFDIVISSDSHSREAFGVLNWGVIVARRAWLQPGDVLNTLPFDEFRSRLRRNRR